MERNPANLTPLSTGARGVLLGIVGDDTLCLDEVVAYLFYLLAAPLAINQPHLTPLSLACVDNLFISLIFD